MVLNIHTGTSGEDGNPASSEGEDRLARDTVVNSCSDSS